MEKKKRTVKSLISLLLTVCLMFEAIGMSMTAFAAVNKVTGDVIGELDYTIDNPYKDVDWDTWYQYKGATHVHTHTSDGDEDKDEMIEKYYELGYHLMSLTDHGTVNYGWTISKGRHTIFEYQNFVHGSTSPLSATREAQINAGVGRADGIGMIDVPLGIELNGASTKKVHINSFFVDAGDGDMEMDADWPSDAIAKTQRAVAPDGGKGVCHINHVGEWSGGNDDVGTYNESFVNRFAQIFRDYDVCVGMELVNTSDGRTRNDRVLYDKTLMKLAPEGRNVFGFCEDDSHEFSDCGRNINYYIMPELTWQAARTSMTTGAFFASAQNAKTPDELGSGFVASGEFPRIYSINVDESKDQIVFDTKNANKFKVVADGVIIENINTDKDGEVVTLDLNAYEDSIGSYIRVYLTGPGGITYVQPFLLKSTPKATSTLNFEIPYDDYDFRLTDLNGNVISPVNSDNCYIVDAGTYNYTVTKFGFVTLNDSVTVTQDQIDSGEDVTVKVILENDDSVSFVYFYVPETIYLDPANHRTFKHYVDRENSPNGAISRGAVKTTGNIYFSCKDASGVTITAETVSGTAVSGMKFGTDEMTTLVSTNAESLSTSITYGELAAASTEDTIIKWTATYTLYGATLQVYAYSYVYSLIGGYGSVAAAGGYAKTSKAAGWLHSSMSVTGTVWLAGAQRISGGSNAYKFPYYGVEGSVEADGTGALVVNGSGMNTASDDSNGGSVTVRPVGGTAHITIDTSRTTNYNQIPFLAVGLDVNYSGSTEDGCENYLNFGELSLYYDNFNAAERSGQRAFFIDNTISGAINKSINTDEKQIAVTGRISGGKSSRTDSIEGTVYLEPSYVNKSSLRTLVNNEIMLARQASTISDQTAFVSYLELVKHAYIVLGNPEATQSEIDSAYSNLVTASEGLIKKTSTATVKFKSGANVVFNEITNEFELGSMIVQEVPEIDGYTFNDWVVYKNFTKHMSGKDRKIQFFADFENLEVELNYTAHAFNVTYDALGGEFTIVGGNGNNAAFGSDYALPVSIPSKPGYIFDSWKLDINDELYLPGDVFNYRFESDAVFTALYRPEVYDVSFDIAGGDEFVPVGVSGDTIEFDSSFSLPINIPTNTGYNFAGWHLDIANELYSAGQTITWTFAGNGTFVAQWIPVRFTVCFDAGEGATGSIDPIVTDYDTPFVLPDYGHFEKVGYEQVGWLFDGNKYYAGDSLYNLTTVEGDTVTLTAVWGYQAYTLFFDTGVEGLECASGRVEYLTAYGKLPTPNNPGYSLIGWYTEKENGTLVSADTVVTTASDHTLYARWKANSYKVSFITNDDAVICDPLTVVYGETYDALPVPQRTGYTLLGWYLDGDKIENDTVISTPSDHSLTASWLPKSYSVSFEHGTSETINNITVTFGSEYESLPVVSQDDYWFRGWYLGDVLISEDTIVSTAENHTLVAKWEEKVSVKVSFDSECEQLFDSVDLIVEDVYGELPVPEKSGYSFDGWYLNDELISESSIVSNAQAHTLTAHWIANEYTVSFDTGYNDVKCKDMTVTFGASYGELPVPLVYGYTFAGWTLDAEDITKDTVVATPENHTLTAKWIPNKYTVSFTTGFDGVECESVEATFGQAYPELPKPNVPGYIFNGWFYVSTQITTESIVNLATDHTLVAKWSTASYLVSFDENGGSECSDIAVTYLSSYSNLPTTERKGYTFGGWSYGDTVVTNETIVTVPGPHILKAMWVADTYIVSFDSSGGTYVNNISVTYGEPYGKLPIPVLNGFVFDYWTLNGAKVFEDTIVTFTYDHTLIANWSPVQYLTVTFDSNGGTPAEINSISVANGETYGDLETPKRSGYQFLGWFYNDEQISYNSVVKAKTDHTLTAKWSPLPYTVTFNANGGSECESVTVYHDGIYGKLPVPVRQNYEFAGWYFDEMLVNEGDALALNNSHTLDAAWTPIKILVSFDSNGGSACEPIEVSYGYTYANLPKPTYAGFAFAGWTLNGVLVTNSTRMNLTEAHTLVATWIEGRTYNVSFVDNTGVEVCDSIVVGENEAFFAKLPVPELPGRTFVHWYYGDDYAEAINESSLYIYNEDITLTAYSTPNKYTVYFDANSGNVDTDSKTVTYSLRYGTLPTATHKYGEFLGWYLNDTLVTASSTVVTPEDHTLVAKWNYQYLLVSFDTGVDGMTVDGINIVPETDYGTLPVLERDGYAFDGWYYNGEKVNDDDALLERVDHTLTAKWTKLYTVVWTIEGESTVETYRLGETITIKEIPERIGFTSCWDKNIPETMPNKNLSFVAVYVPIKYTITWITEEETFVDEYYYNDKVVAREIPTKLGSDVVWDSDIPKIMPAENLIITAVYTSIKYTITWSIDDSTQVHEYYYGDDITAVDIPEKFGYTSGWSITIPETMPAVNLYIKAVYTPINFTIKWIIGEQEIVDTCPYASVIVVRDIPELRGHDAAWNVSVPETMPANDLEFIAVYTPQNYTITYVNDDDAEFEFEAPVTHTYGTRTYIPNMIKEGYTFDGWILNGINYGSDLVISATAFTKDMTLEPTWILKKHTVTISTTTGGVVKLYVDGEFISPDKGKITLDYGTVVQLKPVSVCGYELSSISATSNGKTVMLDGDYSFTVDGDIKFKATYALSETMNLINVTGGTINARHSLAVPMYGVVSVVADEPAEGMKFAYWQNNSEIVSYDSVYTFNSVADLDLTAVYVTEDTVFERDIIVTTYSADSSHVTNVNGAFSLSYYGTVYVPEGFEIVETGIVLTNLDEASITAENLVIGSANTAVLKSTIVNEYGQIKVSVNNVDEGQTRTARCYLIYTDGVSTYTVYGNTWSALTAA